VQPEFALRFVDSFERYQAEVRLVSAGTSNWTMKFQGFVPTLFAAIGLIMVLRSLHLSWLLSYAIFLVIGVLCHLYYRNLGARRLRRIYDVSRKKQQELRIDFYDDRLECAGESSRTIWPWKAIEAVRRDEDFLYLMFAKTFGLLIPLAAFTGAAEIAAIEAFASARVGADRSSARTISAG
jgi:hypothetical protein